MQATHLASIPTPRHKDVLMDKLSEASRLMHRGARLPFEAAHPQQWANEFARSVVAARRALVDHILDSERVDSELNKVHSCTPRLRPLIERQADEHRELLASCHDLAEAAQQLNDPGLWDMVELSERAKALEVEINRHHERRLDLVYEAAYRELGGEAG